MQEPEVMNDYQEAVSSESGAQLQCEFVADSVALLKPAQA